MARFNYAALSKKASKLIDRFAYDAVIRRTVDDVVTEYPVAIVMTEYKPADKDGELILQTDRKAILSAVGLTITPDPEQDKLVENGNVLRIVTVTPTAPGGSAIIYELQVRL